MKPPVQPGSKLVLWVDGRGLWVYGNQSGLVSLALRLLRIAEADPNECFECHVRLELGDMFGYGAPGEVSLNVDEEIAEFFLRLPPDAPADARPTGFELTFMHISEEALKEVKAQCPVGDAPQG